MEYVSETNIFGLKIMVKSGLEFFFMKSLHAPNLFGKYFLLHRKEVFIIKLQSRPNFGAVSERMKVSSIMFVLIEVTQSNIIKKEIGILDFTLCTLMYHCSALC